MKTWLSRSALLCAGLLFGLALPASAEGSGMNALLRPLPGWAVRLLETIAKDQQILDDVDRTLPEEVRRSHRVKEASDLAPLLPAAALAGMLFTHGEARETSKLAAKGLLADAVAVSALKRLAGRDRPGPQGKAGIFHGPNHGGKSFPSGHSSAAFTVATILAQRHPELKSSAYGLAAEIGASRVLLGRHHPSDVLAGALLGIEIGKAMNDE